MSSTSIWSPTTPLAAAARTQDVEVAHGALAPATRLDEFEIIRVLGVGGFGIVYLALDHVLLRYVAIKEYMPTALAGTRSGATVRERSAEFAEPFTLGLESFFNEARLLAGFDHPSLVKVHRFWKANGTAYMAMQYYPGQTLKDSRAGMTAPPDGSWLRTLVEPLLGALDVLHRAGVYHRDISPDNILLLPDGRPVLLDFGSARRVLADRTQSVTAILKPNFAPVEQYAGEGGMRQGPWTDLYALGATVHFMLTGQAPVPAVVRALSESLPCLLSAASGKFPNVPVAFLAAIDWCLALSPGDRPQSVEEMRRVFTGADAPPAPALAGAAASGSARQPLQEVDGDAEASVPATRGLGAPLAPIAISASALTPGGVRSYMRTAVGVILVGVLGLGTWALGSSPQKLPESLPSSAIMSVGTAPVPPPAPIDPPLPVAPLLPMPSNPVTPDQRVGTGPELAAQPPAKALASPRRLNQRNVQGAPPTPRVVADVTTPAHARPPAPREREADAPVEFIKPGLRGPREACDDRNFFSRAICLSRECQVPSFRALPECIEARRAEEQRQRRVDQQ